MKLYEITKNYEEIFSKVNEDGEITNVQLDELDALQEDFNNKCIAVASHIKNLEAESNAINEAIKSMRAREERLQSKIEYLKEYLQDNMQTLQIKEIKDSPFFKIKLKHCPVSVRIDDESQIPESYFNKKISFSLDKMKIKDDLNDGQSIPGATLHRNIKLEIK